jgi:alkyl hydroperoxide reductase subunit D
VQLAQGGADAVVTLEQLVQAIPDYAKDLRVNLPNVLRQTELTEQQTWGTAIACAIASRNAALAEALIAEGNLSPDMLDAARTAAAIMGMNNVFYRFKYLVADERYEAVPARLRMQGLRTQRADPVNFELWCLAVSAVNGCGSCVAAHERAVREKGVSEEQVAAAVRIAAVVNAVAGVIPERG